MNIHTDCSKSLWFEDQIKKRSRSGLGRLRSKVVELRAKKYGGAGFFAGLSVRLLNHLACFIQRTSVLKYLYAAQPLAGNIEGNHILPGRQPFRAMESEGVVAGSYSFCVL